MGVYGLFFNLTYVDEAKYLIKGWLMTTKQVGYYSTKGFFYQHMPGGLLWYGLGQKLFGPNLLVARIQSWVLGLGIFWLSYLTAKKLFDKKTGMITISLLSLTPVVALYYSSAVPQSVTAVLISLGFWSLSQQKRYWASFWFSLLLIGRENFLFSLGFYVLWLFWYFRKEMVKHLLVILATLSAFMLPGLPGILNVFKNYPGINLLIPISNAEKQALVNWQQQTHNLDLYFRAVKEFGMIYFVWFLALIGIILMRKKFKPKVNNQPVWKLLQLFFWFNLLAHGVAAFQLSPRSIVSYFAYFAPLGAIMAAAYLSKLKEKKLVKGYGLLLLTMPLMILSSIFTRTNVIKQLNDSRNNLVNLVGDKNKIIWLAEPMSLYLAGKVSYYPLINHTNFFKTSQATEVVQVLGFWNQELMSQWLNEAELVVVDPNRLKIMEKSDKTQSFATWFEEELETNWEKLTTKTEGLPERLVFYDKSLTTL